MRQRLRPLRDRAMARRPGENGRFTLPPRARRMAGWAAAIALILAIALGVRFLGGAGDDAPGAATSTPGPSAAGNAAITFGTALDEAAAVVPTEARLDRFGQDDTFAYSVPHEGDLPEAVFVEVERVAGGTPEVVQDAATQGRQPIPPGRPGIAFTVPASVLLSAFGPGEYLMRIYVDPAGEAIGEGRFTLIPDAASPSTPPADSPSTAPSTTP